METLSPIRRQKTLTEQAADAIRARIVEGEFGFGEALSEIALANELGVSKTPVREAFLQLKNEGLVEIQPQRGTFVFQMSTEQMRQLWEMREVLEINALRFGMRDGSDALSRRLTPIVDRMGQATRDRDPVVYRKFDAEFHATIISGASNSFIQSAYNIIALRVQAFRNRLSPEAHDWRSLDEHVEVADCIRAHDTEAAADSLFRHIRSAFETYIRRVGSEPANVA